MGRTCFVVAATDLSLALCVHHGPFPPVPTAEEGAGLDHIPSGHYHANAAWLVCAVLAHNLGAWTTQLADQPPATNRTRRTRLVNVLDALLTRNRVRAVVDETS